MTEKTKRPEQADRPDRVETPAPTIERPARYIALETEAAPSDEHACGERRLRAFLGRRDVAADLAAAVTQRCYRLEAGGSCRITVKFIDDGKEVRPKGTLVFVPERGKLKPLRVELDGKKGEVTAEYTAPDETIKVSVRAFLDGFVRGKLHLHLE